MDVSCNPGNKLGLYTHGMAGFNENLAYELLNVSPDEYKAVAAIAIGILEINQNYLGITRKRRAKSKKKQC